GGDPLLAAPPLDDAAGTEYAPQVIHSMVTGVRREIHVNVPNTSLIDGLPARAVVEVPAVIDAQSLTPIPMNDLPPVGLALNAASVSVASLTIDAALIGNPHGVRQALLIDPNASSSATPEA